MTSRVSAGFLALLLCAPLSSLAAPAKSSAAKKAAPVVKGMMVEGRGVATFRATFVRGNSNILGTPFNSIGRQTPKRSNSRRYIVSSSIAQVANGYSVVINFIRGRSEGDNGPPRPERDIERERPESDEDRLERPSSSFSVTFASPGGFRAGQIIPVLKPAYSNKPRPANALLSYDDSVRIEGREVVDGNGKRRRTGKNVLRTWIGVSGTVRIQGVNPDKITFSVQNARFTAPVTPGIFQGQNGNEGRGSFTVNGFGQSTFNEVD